jgi:hypothetical protein
MVLGVGIRAEDTAVNPVLSPNIPPSYNADACAGIIHNLETNSLCEFTIDQVSV